MKTLLGFFSLLFLLACQSPSTKVDSTSAVKVVDKSTPADKLSDYWYQGKAEITSYTLSQNRYKDVHPGNAVLVFVTEDFLTDKQVKNDNYTNPNSIPILKMNRVEAFPTGLYDYHIMTSTFTPAELAKHPHTLKVTNSTTEWCGQVFTQLNYDKGHYKSQMFSYFENEGDQQTKVKAALLEDEILNRIRINPQALPTGKVDMLPGTTYARLTHKPFEKVTAMNTMMAYEGSEFEGEGLMVYKIEYPSFDRVLEIVFEREAPHKIAGWRDTYPSMFDRQPRTSIAKRKKSLMNAYWSKNSLSDMALRAELGLD